MTSHRRKKPRSRKLPTAIAGVAEYVRAYQTALRALLGTVPAGVSPSHAGMVATGRSELWPCTDAAVVLTYDESTPIPVVEVKAPTGMTATAFFENHHSMAFYSSSGTKTDKRVSPDLTPARVSALRIASLVFGLGPVVFRPRYTSAWILGWDYTPPPPDQEALTDFRAAFLKRNIAEATVPPTDPVQVDKKGALNLLSRFRELLADVSREEDLQQFLRDNPALLYPDFIQVFPKLRLGTDFITDFVLTVQSGQGLEHVFVEIEKPGKKVVTADGHFTADFTQAKNQLLNWDNWITRNHAYLRESLPELHKPVFHLVMGRTADLPPDARRIVQAEFMGTNRRFSTYDDLANRFESIVQQVFDAA